MMKNLPVTKAMITDIKRFAVHDGDGIRTTVFFKGCSLRCAWCHNPETIFPKCELAFYEHKCTLCGKCAVVCPNHAIVEGRHIFLREQCRLVSTCTKVCPNDALTIYGKEMEISEICQVLLKDKEFYENSGGGITLSGGECLLQPEACRAILENMKRNGVSTAVDTAGNVLRENIDAVIGLTDVFLYDVKHIDSQKHRVGTGSGNELILSNLKYISDKGGTIEIRIPIIPDFNDDMETMEKIGLLLQDLKGITKVRLLPYHNYAQSKYDALGKSVVMRAMGTAKIQEMKELLAGYGLTAI